VRRVRQQYADQCCPCPYTIQQFMGDTVGLIIELTECLGDRILLYRGFVGSNQCLALQAMMQHHVNWL
jgi:hypothetical protein